MFEFHHLSVRLTKTPKRKFRQKLMCMTSDNKFVFGHEGTLVKSSGNDMGWEITKRHGDFYAPMRFGAYFHSNTRGDEIVPDLARFVLWCRRNIPRSEVKRMGHCFAFVNPTSNHDEALLRLRWGDQCLTSDEVALVDM